MMFRRHIPQEERSTTIQQALYLVLRRIDLRMVFTQPVFQAISLPWFQNQSFNQFGLALFLIVKERKFHSIGLCNAESARHLLLLPKHYFRSEPEFRERNPNFFLFPIDITSAFKLLFANMTEANYDCSAERSHRQHFESCAPRPANPIPEARQYPAGNSRSSGKAEYAAVLAEMRRLRSNDPDRYRYTVQTRIDRTRLRIPAVRQSPSLPDRLRPIGCAV